MGELIGAVRHNLSHLLRFGGRETRGSFWRYILFLYVLQMAISMIGGIVVMSQIASRQAATFQSLLETVFLLIAIFAVAAVALLAAAVTRRLHDSGRSGSWGLMPVPFLGAGLVGFQVMMRELPPDDTTFLMMLGNNFAYLIAVGILVFLLARPGTPGTNRFGPDPRNP
jgi:uncharacterized membrane protein YhaH (DUF805 family)